MNTKKKRFHYPSKSIRIDPKVLQTLGKIKQQYGLTWNLLFVELIKEWDRNKNRSKHWFRSFFI